MKRYIFVFFRFLMTFIWKWGVSIANFLRKFIKAIHRRKRFYIPFYAFNGYLLFVIILIIISGDSNYNKVLTNKRLNDITQLNSIQLGKEIQPKTIEEIVDAIKSTTGKISIGGGRYSMGGQIGYQNSLHLDMRQFNKVVKLDTKKKQVTVQSGIVWRDLQKVIDQKNLSVKIMQTYANFSVGGSISVNCHGRYIGHGPIISSVLELKLVSASGEIIIANRERNQDIFYATIGGYGGIGVIAEATLQLVDNERVERQTALLDVEEYRSFFNKEIRNDTNVIFQNGDLYPPNFETIRNVSWKRSSKDLTDTTRVTPEGVNYWMEPKLVELASWGDFGKWVRRKCIDPLYYSNEKVVWRNKEASYDVAELEPSSREKYTYVLQEYFIPVNNIESFIPKMKAVYNKYDVNVINVSLRHAFPDHESYLSWADEEVFAFVIYYKQGTDEESKTEVEAWTIEMTDAILSEKGKWYLPYQPHATDQQFRQAFPRSKQYFEVKNKVDSLHRFNNYLLDKYNPYLTQKIEHERKNIKGYFREEEQTILTVPEWYLVFNPKEYADFLEAGNNPSDFPFYASIDEYWKLYDRSQMLVSEAYEKNGEYNTMLQVIGVSVTLEYAAKMIYENTIGRLFSWFDNGSISEKEKTIIEAQRAYSDFIYHTAWYEFDFLPWIKKVWSASEANNANWFRKWERTLFFTFEYSFKAAYAKLIELGANASYEEPVTSIYLLISSPDEIPQNRDIKLIEVRNEKQIIGIKRWGSFTTAILELAKYNIKIHEIGGNDEVAISFLLDKEQDMSFEASQLLYESAVVTNSELKRYVCILPVEQMLPIIRYAKQNNVEVEHIYDY